MPTARQGSLEITVNVGPFHTVRCFACGAPTEIKDLFQESCNFSCGRSCEAGVCEKCHEEGPELGEDGLISCDGQHDDGFGMLGKLGKFDPKNPMVM